MPAAVTQRHAIIPTAPQPHGLLFDFSTTHHGGTTWYGSARGREDQSGAVAARAARVHSEYVRHARRLDQAHHPGTHPIQDRLEQFGQTRAAVIGSYSECSPDVHSLCSLPLQYGQHGIGRSMDHARRPSATASSSRPTAARSECTRRERWHGTVSSASRTWNPSRGPWTAHETGRSVLGGGGYREHAIGAEAADLARHQALVGRYGLNFQAA